MEDLTQRSRGTENGRAGTPCQPPPPHAPWPRVKLGEVCEVRAGADYKTVQNANGKYPIYGTGGEMGRANECRCPAGTVIVGRKGTLDNPLLIKEPFWNIDTCFGVVPCEKVVPEFLHFFCKNFDFYSLVPACGRPSTNSSAIKAIDFPLPPLSVQREIVAKLERELAAVDAMEKKFEEMATTAETGFKAELKEVFDEISRGGAETRRLGEVCEFIADCPHTTAKDEGEGYPLIRTPNVGFMRLVYSDMHRVSESVYRARTTRGVPHEGDLIFAREAPAGNVAVIQRGEIVCLGQRTVLLRLKKGIALSDYVALYILSPESQGELLKRSVGATVTHVNVADIRELPIMLPEIAEQKQIVARLDAARERKEKLVAAAKKGAETAALLRKALLKEAFE